MNGQQIILLSLAALLCCDGSPGFAQPTQKDKPTKSATKTPEEVVAVFKSWDKNQDGLLHQKEIPEAQRSKVAESCQYLINHE